MTPSERYEQYRQSMIWREPERIDDANDYYRRDLARGDDEITLEDAWAPPVFKPLIDQRPLGPKDVPYSQSNPNPSSVVFSQPL